MTTTHLRFKEVHHWLNPLHLEQTQLRTPFEPNEIERELHPFMDYQTRPSDPGPILEGHFEPDGFRLRGARFDKRFGWPIWLTASYEPSHEGTFLTLKQASNHPWTPIFLLAAVAAALAAFLNLRMHEFLFGGVYVLVALSQLTIYAMHRRRSRRAIDNLRRFLIFVLMAEDSEADTRG